MAGITQGFDPYHKWLGIPPDEQPPHHYRLLGLKPFEADREVISHAADQRMVHVRSFQAGKNGALSQKILNELAAARVCLLQPPKKAEYDEALRQRLTAHDLELIDVVPAPPPLESVEAPATEAPPQMPPPAAPYLPASLPVPPSDSGFPGFLLPSRSSPTANFPDDLAPPPVRDVSLPAFEAPSRRLPGSQRKVGTSYSARGSRKTSSAVPVLMIVAVIVVAILGGIIAIVVSSNGDDSSDNAPTSNAAPLRESHPEAPKVEPKPPRSDPKHSEKAP